MDVYAFDPFVDDEAIKKDGVTPVGSVEELYETCQYVSLHIPETPQTMNSINFELLSKMPRGATLVNTARLGVIDEDGLMKMFAERSDFVYLSDISPTCKDDIVSNYDNRGSQHQRGRGSRHSDRQLLRERRCDLPGELIRQALIALHPVLTETLVHGSEHLRARHPEGRHVSLDKSLKRYILI
jgi:hypothetical protein